MTCSKCTRPVRCRGLCRKHYEKARRLVTFKTVMVDAQPVREHLQYLISNGMGTHRIADVSGVGRNVIQGILIGTRNRSPSSQVVRRNANKLLSVQIDLADGAAIEALGSMRRLRALVALGYTQTDIANRIGVQLPNLGKLIHARQKHVSVKIARRISQVYDELLMKPGPSNRARRMARNHGWLPPLAWDDIDDPNEHPAKPKRCALRWDEKFYEMRSLGYSEMEICRRWNVNPNSVMRQMARYGISPSPQMVTFAGQLRQAKVSA